MALPPLENRQLLRLKASINCLLEETVNKLDPYLNNPLSFYGTYLDLKKEDRINIASHELNLYYKGIATLKDTEAKVATSY